MPDTSTGSNTFRPDFLASQARHPNGRLRRNPFRGEIMKVIQSLLVAAVVALPALSFAQSNEPLTRAAVRAQLVELERAGYNPAGDQTQYPQNIEASEARLSAQHAVVAS